MTPGNHATTETLADHAEGLLGEAEARRVDAHLAQCADCRSTARLLQELPAILAMADPGPMPAHYAARINATLARLAVTEPVVPGAAEPGAQVIDLSARRRTVADGLRRVGTAAAAVVLLVSGIALGVQTVGSHGGRTDNRDASGGPRPLATAEAAPAAEIFDIPADAVPDKHGNYVTPKGGTIYVPRAKAARKASKIIRADGAEIVQDAVGNPHFLTPPRRAKPAHRARPSAAPKLPGVGTVPVVPPATAQPYVTASGGEYNEDNFAGRVMDLVADADQHSDPSVRAPAPSGGDVFDPAAPPDVFAGSRLATANRSGTASDPGARVLRCAARTGRHAIAGDEGLWGDHPATIVVVQGDNPDQVIGYVFYGECTRSGPITAQDSPWEQQVDDPDTQPAPTQPAATEPAATRGDVGDRSAGTPQQRRNWSEG